jgi:catalase
MNGYGAHTYKWVNSQGEDFFVKFHFKSTEGTINLKSAQAAKLAGEDPDYATRDLFNHFASGKEAVWRFYVQVMPAAFGEAYKWDIYDATKVWPHSDYPLIEVGKLVLNRSPANHFAETEQAAFCPANMVPGIEPSNDKLLQGRMFSYTDTHRHRLGANFMKIPVNCPYMARAANYQRDGPMAVDSNGGSEPNYEPNSLAGTPKEIVTAGQKTYTVSGNAARFAYNHNNNDFEQPGVLFRKVFDDENKDDVVSNIVGHLKTVTRKEIQERQVWNLYRSDPEYGGKVAQGVGVTIHKAKL